MKLKLERLKMRCDSPMIQVFIDDNGMRTALGWVYLLTAHENRRNPWRNVIPNIRGRI